MDRELVNEVSEMSGLMNRLDRPYYEYTKGDLRDRIEQLERELDQLTAEWKEEMSLRMSVAQELRAEKARNEKNKTVAANATVLASDRGFEIERLQADLAAEKALADALWRLIVNVGDGEVFAAYRKARGL